MYYFIGWPCIRLTIDMEEIILKYEKGIWCLNYLQSQHCATGIHNPGSSKFDRNFTNDLPSEHKVEGKITKISPEVFIVLIYLNCIGQPI